jgi:hypothetical protein
LLAVINDQIQPPITIQNRINKQTFDTYAYTIDLVPLVLEEICFAGHTFEYKWKTKPKAQSRKQHQQQQQQHKAESIMQKCAKKIHGEAHLHATFGPSTNVDKA